MRVFQMEYRRTGHKEYCFIFFAVKGTLLEILERYLTKRLAC